MGGNPIGDALVTDAQQSPNPPEVDAIHVQAQGLLAHDVRVPHRTRRGRVFSLASFADRALTARLVVPNLPLAVSASAMRAGDLIHASSLQLYPHRLPLPNPLNHAVEEPITERMVMGQRL